MRRHHLSLLAMLLLCASCRAQLARYRADFHVSATAFADTIAIEWRQQQVYVPVGIGGRVYRFLLDTGAGQAVVYDDAPFIGDCADAGRIISHDAIGRADTVSMVTLPPILLGTTTLTGCQATVQRGSKNRRCDGILGFDIVNGGLNLKIDVQNRRLIISDLKDCFDAETGFDVRYKLNFHVPYVAVNPFDRYSHDALFDTGSRAFYAMSKHDFDEAGKVFAAARESQVEGRSQGRHAIGHLGVEPRGEVVFLGLSSLKVGDVAFTDVHTMTTQGGSHLGAALLEECTVAFNGRRKRMRLSPCNGRTTVQVANRQTEISFVPERGMPVVGVVWQGGEPWRCGFREGDTVVKIDGRPVQSMAQFERWGFERGRAYKFTLRDRRGFQREVEWVRLPAE